MVWERTHSARSNILLGPELSAEAHAPPRPKPSAFPFFIDFDSSTRPKHTDRTSFEALSEEVAKMAGHLLKGTVEMASKFREGGIRSIVTKTKASGVRENAPVEKVKEIHRAPRQLTVGARKTAGRNSAGRITSFHRGGGAKRLQRMVDLKRSTPSTGIIERIDYDPNRSSRLSLVRWVDGVHSCGRRKGNMTEKPAPPRMIVEAATTTTCGQFSLSSLSGKGDERPITCHSSRPSAARVVVVGTLPCSKSLFTKGTNGIEKASARDIFVSSFASKDKGNHLSRSSSSLNLPRLAVAGAKPSLSALQRTEEVEENNTLSHLEVRKWKMNSAYWTHRIKRKAAVSWQSLRV